MDVAAWIVTAVLEDLAWSLMPASMVWKNGLSRPLITAATLAVPPVAPEVEPDPLEPQAEMATRAAAVTEAATPRWSAMRVMGGVLCVSGRFRLIRCPTYDGCQAKDWSLPYSGNT
jgi:hypothetical protein